MKKKIGTRAKKIVLSSLCVVGLLAFAAPPAKGQAMTALTGTRATRSISEEIAEFMTLVAQGKMLATQVQATYKRYDHLVTRTKEIKRRMKTDAFKMYKGKFDPRGVLDKVGMANYQASIAEGLISQATLLSTNISRVIATTQSLRISELTAIGIASVKHAATSGAANVGLSNDPGPVIAAVTLMSGNAQKDGVKETLSFVIKLLTEVNKSLMELSYLIDIAYDAVEEAIRMGGMVIAVNTVNQYDKNGGFKLAEDQKKYAEKKKKAMAELDKEREEYRARLLKDKPVQLKTVSLFK